MFDSVRFKGYKSFPVESNSEIVGIRYLNLFIGKNNCGKSSALDVIGASCDFQAYKDLPNKPGIVELGYIINEELLRKAMSGTTYSHAHGFSLAQRHVGETYWIEQFPKSGYLGEYNHFERQFKEDINDNIRENNVRWGNYLNQLPKNEYIYAKVSAERNIVQEAEVANIELLPDGTGATNLIRKIINHKKYDENIIEDELLNALNKIMADDAQFKSIRIQECEVSKEDPTIHWEVYLQEEHSTRFPLSQSGSGLKTIILVLLNLLVLPLINPKRKYVFGFEELENNLHPALQRRLFQFIYDYAVEKQTYIFLTTHSHVAINMFYGKEFASIYHVVKEEQVSRIKKIDNYVDKVEILDDLDVKASDLLQANGIIWVEGPSDRIYIKKWLEVFGGDDVQEGKDFQFAYYGGRLLSHYSTDEECRDLINILLINRNSAIVMDSDKRNRSTPINETKKRIEKEFSEKNLFSWITKGKEIENYLTVTAVSNALGVQLDKQCDQYELFPEYIKKSYAGFVSKKVPFASAVKEYIDDQNILDLEIKVKRLYHTVKSWN